MRLPCRIPVWTVIDQQFFALINVTECDQFQNESTGFGDFPKIGFFGQVEPGCVMFGMLRPLPFDIGIVMIVIDECHTLTVGEEYHFRMFRLQRVIEQELFCGGMVLVVSVVGPVIVVVNRKDGPISKGLEWGGCNDLSLHQGVPSKGSTSHGRIRGGQDFNVVNAPSYMFWCVFVCVCVCVRERERERERASHRHAKHTTDRTKSTTTQHQNETKQNKATNKHVSESKRKKHTLRTVFPQPFDRSFRFLANIHTMH